jgi:hypothetical protein
LHDPTKQPLDFIQGLRDAKTHGWSLVVLMGAWGVLEVLAFAGAHANVPLLAKLGKGRASILIAGGVAVLAATYNALTSAGGSWTAALMAAAGAALFYAHPAAKDVTDAQKAA